MALVYLKNSSDWTLSTGLKLESDRVELSNLIAEDTFDDGIINTSLWGTDIVGGSGSAVVVEDATNMNIKTTALNSGAIIYYQTDLNPRTSSRWKIHFKIRTLQGGIITSGLIQKTATPIVDSLANIQDKELAEVAISSTGGVYFGYWDNNGQRFYWSSGKGWSVNQEYAYRDTLAKHLVFEFENNGTDLIFRIINCEESEVLVYSSISWSSVRPESGSLYFYAGDPFNNLWFGEMDVFRFIHKGDYPTGQVAIMGETAIETFIDQLPIAEFLETGASISWRYNKDGNGFILPGSGKLTDLREAIEGDYFNTLDLEASFSTDGLACASFEINGGVLGSKPSLSFNLPLEIMDLTALEVVEI